jgi:hypothetical protein
MLVFSYVYRNHENELALDKKPVCAPSSPSLLHDLRKALTTIDWGAMSCALTTESAERNLNEHLNEYTHAAFLHSQAIHGYLSQESYAWLTLETAWTFGRIIPEFEACVEREGCISIELVMDTIRMCIGRRCNKTLVQVQEQFYEVDDAEWKRDYMIAIERMDGWRMSFRFECDEYENRVNEIEVRARETGDCNRGVHRFPLQSMSVHQLRDLGAFAYKLD